jgi:hypothetical protein
MSKAATIRVPGFKVTVPLPADSLPRDLVPADGPPGEPTIDLVLEIGLTARAKVNGHPVAGGHRTSLTVAIPISWVCGTLRNRA